jgi:FkbM family methyltransferase
MAKILTFIRYSIDFFKHGEIHYFLSSVKYLLTGKPTSHCGLYKSSLGYFFVRKGTLDFQFGNYAYEWNVKKFVLKYLKNYNKFIDVGANIGTYTILFAKNGLSGCAFEPVKENFFALKKNVNLNRIEDKVKLFQLALGSYEHDAEFIFTPINTGATHISIINTDSKEKGINKVVKIIPLDKIIDKCNFLPGKDKIIMKIDVEGMEAKVLEGAKGFLKSFPDILIIMESVHSGKEKLKEILHNIDNDFNFLDVDNLNVAAIKDMSSKKKKNS